MPFGGGRTWWPHFEFTLINIEPTFLYKKIEDLRTLGAFGVSFDGIESQEVSHWDDRWTVLTLFERDGRQKTPAVSVLVVMGDPTANNEDCRPSGDPRRIFHASRQRATRAPERFLFTYKRPCR